MEAVFDLWLPESWAELSDEQLRMVFRLFARDLSGAEVKTLCLLRWNKLEIVNEHPEGTFLMKREMELVALTARQIQQATAVLDFLDELPAMPIRLAHIGRHRALAADFEGVPFEKYLYVENLFQGFLHTEEESLLLQMAQVLYQCDRIKPTKAELVSVFYWFASLKQYFARLFPHFFQPIGAANDGGNLMGSRSLFDQLYTPTICSNRKEAGGYWM